MKTQTKREDFQLLLTVINSEITSLNNESTILFEIEMISEITKKDWKVSRTFFNIKQLYKTLIKSYLNVPDISSILNINLNKFSSSRDMVIIRECIQNFLNELIDRADLINSSHVKTFLELDNHQHDYMQYQPLLLNELAESMEISDFQYHLGHSLLFVGTAYSANTGRISSYVSSLSSLWNSTFLGAITIYHVARTNYEEIMLEKLYEQSLQSQVNKIAFFEGDTIDILAVGLHDGSVLLYRVNSSQSNAKDTKTELVDQFSRIKPHKHPILDFGIEADFGYIYTAAVNEKTIAISEINYETVIKNVPVSGNSISCFKYDKESKRIIVIDVANSIWIMQVVNYINILPIQAFHGQTSLICCISIEPDLNFFFTGSDNGVITLYDYNDSDSKTKFSLNKKLDIQTGVKVTNVKYKQSKHEVISSFSNGSVAFWTHYEDNPEFVLDCHEKKVTKIQYEESMKLFITASTDKTLKLWHLPEFWPSEAMRKDKQTNDRFFLEDYLETTANTHLNMSKLQDALKSFGSENIFHEEKTSRKTSKENRESMNIIVGEEKIEGDVDGEENKRNLEHDESSENSLDGWDAEIVQSNPRNKLNINSSFNDLFLI